MKPSFYIWLQRVLDILIGDREVEPLGIEMATAPGLGFPMLGTLGGADYLQKLLIAWNAADILGWTGSRAVNTGRVLGSAFEEK